MFTKLIAAASLAFVGVASATTPVAAAPAAGSATLMMAAAAPAAQDRRYRDHDRRWDRDRHRGWDRRRYYHRRYHSRRVCWTEWRHHHRVTVCRRR